MEERRLRKISDLINQFVASITHKPLESKLDQARVKAFVSALRDCLGKVQRPKEVEVVETVRLSDEEKDEQMKRNLEAIKKIKEER